MTVGSTVWFSQKWAKGPLGDTRSQVVPWLCHKQFTPPGPSVLPAVSKDAHKFWNMDKDKLLGKLLPIAGSDPHVELSRWGQGNI